MSRKPKRTDQAFTRQAVRDSIPVRSGRTAAEIAAISGFSMMSVRRVLAELRAAGKAHIFGWQCESSEDGERCGQPKALYARGSGEDASRPAKLKKSVVSSNYRGRRDRKMVHKILFDGDK